MQRENQDFSRQHDATDEFCPYIGKRLPECYGVAMDKRKLNLAMRFCLKDFESCRIYRRIYLQEAPTPPLLKM